MRDLKINSIADKGFYEKFVMSPELHVHSYYEILLSLEGGFFLNLSDSANKEIQKGNFFLIPPEMHHGTLASEEKSRKLALRFRYAKETEKRQGESLYELFHRTMITCQDVVLSFILESFF